MGTVEKHAARLKWIAKNFACIPSPLQEFICYEQATVRQRELAGPQLTPMHATHQGLSPHLGRDLPEWNDL